MKTRLDNVPVLLEIQPVLDKAVACGFDEKTCVIAGLIALAELSDHEIGRRLLIASSVMADRMQRLTMGRKIMDMHVRGIK